MDKSVGLDYLAIACRRTQIRDMSQSSSDLKTIETSDVEHRDANVLPRAVLQQAKLPLGVRMRAYLGQLTLLGVVRGLFLAPLVAYMLAGTAALFAVSQLEAIAVRFASWELLRRFRPTAWHDRGLWLVVAFPIVAPPLLLRAIVLLSATVISGATSLLTKLVRVLASGIQSIGRWFIEVTTNGLRYGLSKIGAMLSLVWGWSSTLFGVAARWITCSIRLLWGWFSDQLRYIRGLASALAQLGRSSILYIVQWIAAQGSFVVYVARGIREFTAQVVRVAGGIAASLLATVSRTIVAAANKARVWLARIVGRRRD